MCTRSDCSRMMGQWVRFQTPWGLHRGIVSDMNQQAVLVRVPRQYAPIGLASHNAVEGSDSDEQRLDLALAQYGNGRNGGWGYPGNGGWYGGWWWWWLAFAAIFWLAFLW